MPGPVPRLHDLPLLTELSPQVGRENRTGSGGGDGGGGLPKSCGSNWDVHHSRYLNGTVYKTIALPENGSH